VGIVRDFLKEGYPLYCEAPDISSGGGSYISGAKLIDFTADLHEIEGKPIAKRGRIPSITPPTPGLSE